MSDVAKALRTLADLFERLEIVYAVVGEIALGCYGIPRATYDVDFTIAISRDRLESFFVEAEDCGLTVPETYRSGWVDSVANMPLIKIRFYLRDRGVDADIFLAETDFQREILVRRQLVETQDGVVWLATPEDVVLPKLVAHRIRDMSDIQDILFTQGPLDESYMRHWAAELGVLPLLNQTLDEWKRDL